MKMHRSRRARAAAFLLATTLGVAAGCNDFLQVDNPGAITNDELADPRYVTLLVNGAIGTLQTAFPQVIFYGSTFTDEARNHHVFFENRNIDLRAVVPENGTANIMYVAMHRARFVADSGAERLRTFLGADSAGRDLRYARMRAYGGYSYILLAETMCTSPINVSRPYTPTELFRDFALPRFVEAIAAARAAKAATGASTATRATADSLIIFASIGAARAAVGAGDNAAAVTFASDPLIVADSARGYPWRMYAHYSTNSAGENNPIWALIASAAGSGSRVLSLTSTPFELTNDPRVPHPDTTEAMQNAIRGIVVNTPSAYSNWVPTDTLGVEILQETDIRIAGTLEARYLRAEAEGPTAANIGFLESRRVLATDNLVAPTTSANYFNNLMDQRAREFFMDAHRLGDLRRFKERYGIDKWQQGAYPGSTTSEVYGQQYCFPLPIGEVNGNPNVPKP